MRMIDHNMLFAEGISPSEAYQWVQEMLIQKPKAVLPPKISMHQAGNIFYNVMPCVLPEMDRVGVKVITRHPEHRDTPSLTSQILLYKASSGELLAILDGSYITAMRTGAVTAHSALLFSNPDFCSIGMIGLGITATATLDILSAILPNRTLTINLLHYKDQAERFINRYKNVPNLQFVIHDSSEAVIRSSEVIISCVTCTEKNFAPTDAYRPGCVVLPVHTMGFQNCDTVFHKIFADDIGHIKDFRYFHQFKSLTEVGSVVRGETPGRDSRDQRILVYNIGLSIHDIYFAAKLIDRFPQAPTPSLSGPAKKMWL